MSARARVLVCDDSAFARKVIREILSRDPSLDVVGTARDGLDALEKIAALRPDVVTLDLVMPHLDGVGVLTELGAGAPRVVIVSSTPEDGDLVVRGLQEGAITSIRKPTSLATDGLYEIGDELLRAVRLAAEARIAAPARAERLAAVTGAAHAARHELVVLGASTGGPRALTRVLEALPRDFPAALALVVHMPVGYTASFAERLSQTCALEVVEARDGVVLRPGRAVVARAGMHLVVHRDGDALVGQLAAQPLDTPHRPAVDVLFASAAAASRARTLGVILTGMGNDGLEGARAIRAAGGEVIAESESSCVVYGMPRAVIEAGLASREAAIDAIPAAIARAVAGTDGDLAPRAAPVPR